jgi:NADH-quinone oxidoreductase subunit G/NADP-reducing hydrogenase subunit HndD
MVTIEVNGRTIQAKPGEMLLAALRRASIHVPTLCNIDGLFPSGACRMCVVEVEGQRNLVPSCAFPVSDGMKVRTHTPRTVRARRTIIELLLANHPDDCLYCVRSGNCQLQTLANDLGVRQRRFKGERSMHHVDMSSPSIVRDQDKCILCGKCVRICDEVQGVAAIDFVGRGSKTEVATTFNQGLNLSSCVNCGQCIKVCPTGALREQSDIKHVMTALNNPDLHVVVQHAPAVSVTLGEMFGFKPGTDCLGLLNSALRRLGFKKVFDTSFSADLTIMEEASELVQRLTTGGTVPMFTSCSPAWIKFMEQFYPDMLGHLSTCKSPQQMLGAVIKSYYAEREGIDPSKIFSVSVMPCTAKKFESDRSEMSNGHVQDVDAVLTVRELARIITMRGIDFQSLEPEPADNPFGQRSTAGKLFGATGGVMEAAIRTAHYLVTGQELKDLKVQEVRGLEGVKEAHIQVGDLTLGVAVVSGLQNAHKLVQQVRDGRKDLHFIEVMSCPGGCIAGGGTPLGIDPADARARMKALYDIDQKEIVRTSHSNESVKRLYDEYLGKPLGEKSHHLLHTSYAQREVVS